MVHKDVPWRVRNNADAAINPDRDATQFVTQRLLLRQEIQWVSDYFSTGVWGTDATPSNLWSSYTTSDPITDIEHRGLETAGDRGDQLGDRDPRDTGDDAAQDPSDDRHARTRGDVHAPGSVPSPDRIGLMYQSACPPAPNQGHDDRDHIAGRHPCPVCPGATMGDVNPLRSIAA